MPSNNVINNAMHTVLYSLTLHVLVLYRTTDDIDLFAGGMSETPLRGGILGPTFSCLLAYQFSLYKHGDRFWYENNDHQNPLAAFTAGENGFTLSRNFLISFLMSSVNFWSQSLSKSVLFC